MSKREFTEIVPNRLLGTSAPPTPEKVTAAAPTDIEFYSKPRATQMLVEDKLTGDQWIVKLDFLQPPGMREIVARKPGDENHDYWQHVWVLRIGDEEIQPTHFPDRAA